MNKKIRLGIFSGVVFIIIIIFIQSYNNKFQNTIEERSKFISQNEIGAVIISETIIENHIVSEIIAGNKYGYAIFAPHSNNRYRWQGTSLTKVEVYSETILINGNSYEILMCQKPNLDYVETVYTNTNNGQIITSIITDLNGKTFVVQKSPDLKSYTCNVIWYDTLGNKYNK